MQRGNQPETVSVPRRPPGQNLPPAAARTGAEPDMRLPREAGAAREHRGCGDDDHVCRTGRLGRGLRVQPGAGSVRHGSRHNGMGQAEIRRAGVNGASIAIQASERLSYLSQSAARVIASTRARSPTSRMRGVAEAGCCAVRTWTDPGRTMKVPRW